jgi:DNA-binding GntR family transcriptional regulator
MRRYGVARGVVHRALMQVMREGWVERAATGGWRFLPLIDGPGGFDESYRFRRAIEPAALLDPAFDLPPRVAARLRREQQGLLARAGERVDPREVFELNSGFHLALMQASNNRFFADAGLRVTRLRRLVGYVIALDTSRMEAQSIEHLAILDRIEAGDRVGAADLLVRHLDAGRAAKVRLLQDPGLHGAALVAPTARGMAPRRPGEDG